MATRGFVHPGLHQSFRLGAIMGTTMNFTNPIEPAAPAPGRAERPRDAKLTPQDWLRGAADLLVEKSIDGVRVDALARQLGVTRGSFYWHFTDRDDLLQRLLQSWKQVQTEQVIAAHGGQPGDAQTVIRELAELPFHGVSARRGGAVELAIRAWARRDDMARTVVDEVDALRLEYIRTIFRALGFDDPQSCHRAFLLYAYMQAESLFRAQGSDADKAARRRFVEQLLTFKSLPF